MKNKEKYSKEIIDFAISDGDMAVDVRAKKPIDCNEISDCHHCLANKSDGTCDRNRIKDWAEEEYKESILDEKEKIFLQFLCDHLRPKIKYVSKSGTIHDLEDAYGCGIITELQYQKAIKKFEPSANSIHVQEVYRQAKEYAEDFLYQIHDDNGPVKKKDEMVKVIRCKDCKNKGHCSSQDTFDLVGMRGNGFCAAGKKK